MSIDPKNRLRPENFVAVGAATLALMVREHHRSVGSSRKVDQWIKCVYHSCVVRDVSHAEKSKQGINHHEPRVQLMNVVYKPVHRAARWRPVKDELDRFASRSAHLRVVKAHLRTLVLKAHVQHGSLRRSSAEPGIAACNGQGQTSQGRALADFWSCADQRQTTGRYDPVDDPSLGRLALGEQCGQAEARQRMQLPSPYV